MAGEVRAILQAWDLAEFSERVIGAGFASCFALAHMDQAAMDDMHLPKSDQPRMWGAVQAAAQAGPNNQSRATSSLAQMAAEPFKNNSAEQLPPRSMSAMSQNVHSTLRSKAPTKLGNFNLNNAGRKTEIITELDGDLRPKQDNMVQFPVGQSFMQPTLKQHATNPAPRLVERPKTYRHATLSARRNLRHHETSLVMPSTEVTRWAKETGFGEDPFGMPSGSGRGSQYGDAGLDFHTNEAPQFNAPSGGFVSRDKSRQAGRRKGNVWWQYASNNAPKVILPHVLRGRRSI